MANLSTPKKIGSLGEYCPILLCQSKIPPLHHKDQDLCPACYSWEKAENVAGKALKVPEVTLENLKCETVFAIDYLLEGKKILCVEDNIVSMKVLTKTLGPLSNLTVKAKNGQEALDYISNNNDIGLILLDLEMPVMDGRTFMEKVMEIYEEDYPFTVVIVSELKNWKQAKILIELGVSSQVKKPYKAEELLEVIKESLYEKEHLKL